MVKEWAKQETNVKQLAGRALHAWPILWSWRWMWYVPPTHRLTFSKLHGIMTQKTELFITTAMRIANRTSLYIVSTLSLAWNKLIYATSSISHITLYTALSYVYGKPLLLHNCSIRWMNWCCHLVPQFTNIPYITVVYEIVLTLHDRMQHGACMSSVTLV
jgi:hypothetical protein